MKNRRSRWYNFSQGKYLIRSSLGWNGKKTPTQFNSIIISKFPQDSPCCLKSPFFYEKSMEKKEPRQGKTKVVDSIRQLFLYNPLDTHYFSRL